MEDREKQPYTIMEVAKENGIQKHILIVDDDPEMLRILRLFLQDDFRVSLVNSGKAAAEFLIKFQPDLILLDYVMPLFNGAAVLKIIRSKEKTKNIPVFFLTGLSDKETVIECLSYNPAGYIVKPVSKDALIQKLNDFFKEHR